MPPKRKAKPTRKNRIPELKVLSREDVEHYEPTLREVCISISDPGAQPAGLSPSFAAVLRISFDDVVERGDPADILFAEEHARVIHRFIDEWSDADRVILHCNMGVSRSPGVALGLCDVQGWATAELERSHPGWNRLVRGVMTKAAGNARQGGSH
ncbi:MAG TPA: hypothetical protein VLJ83_08720 [Gemmatimonadaceae bacterium]|nr:hypothetical protein [Gemmatimonadaceae bacterium]